MNTIKLGDLTVNRLGFGAMRVCGPNVWGPPTDRAEGQRAGKIRHIGLSDVSVKQLEEARRICTIVSVQNRYNLEDRSSESVLKACEKLGTAFLPWYPLGAGSVLRSRKVLDISKSAQATLSQVALAWLLAKSPVMLPIPGTADLGHLEKNAAAAQLALSPEEMKELN